LVSLPENATLVARRGATTDASLQVDRNGVVSLVTLGGRRLWRTRVTSSSQPPQLAAAGDVDGDGFDDFILWTANPVSPPRACGQTGMRSSGLVLVNGGSGSTSSPFPALTDICWDTPTFNYPTQQWDFGSVYIGDFEPALRGDEVVLVPYYATEGT